MTETGLPYLTTSALRALDLIDTALAVFSCTEKGMAWANKSALAFWNARSHHDLCTQMSDRLNIDVATKLIDCSRTVERGEQQLLKLDVGGAFQSNPVAIHCIAVRLDDHADSMLLEFRLPNLASDQRRPDGTLIAVSTQIDESVCWPTASVDAFLKLSPAPAIVISAATAELRMANEAARKLLLREPSLSSDSLASAWGENQRILLDVRGDQSDVANRVELFDKSGNSFVAALSGVRLRVDDEMVMLVIIQPVGDIPKRSFDLETELQIERALSSQQRRMLELAAHEFRTPLAVIDGAAQRLASRPEDQSPEKIVALAGRIREFVARLVSLLENTVERSHAEAVDINCKWGNGRIQDTIAKVITYFEGKAQINIDSAVDQIPDFLFDSLLIEHALINIIENSIKYSDNLAKIRFSVELGDNWLKLFVRDWGIGILPEDRERIFTETYRGANVGQREGSGLGLFIVRAILRAHGGDIMLVETSGPGSTMQIALPLRQMPPQKPTKAARQN